MRYRGHAVPIVGPASLDQKKLVRGLTTFLNGSSKSQGRIAGHGKTSRAGGYGKRLALRNPSMRIPFSDETVINLSCKREEGSHSIHSEFDRCSTGSLALDYGGHPVFVPLRENIPSPKRQPRRPNMKGRSVGNPGASTDFPVAEGRRSRRLPFSRSKEWYPDEESWSQRLGPGFVRREAVFDGARASPRFRARRLNWQTAYFRHRP